MADYIPKTKEAALARVLEEAGEVFQIYGKGLRFGWSSHHPAHSPYFTNERVLDEELFDLQEALEHYRSFN